MDSPKTLGEWAELYASWGWRVFPLSPRSKVPMPGSRGCHGATADAATVRAWWRATPEANIGIATGRGSGIAVVDLDRKAGADGVAAWAKLGGVETTARVATGGGGVQLFYLIDPGGPTIRNTAGRVAPGIDTRGDGGYVVAAPSIHPSGQAYEWIAPPGVVDISPWPADLLPIDAEGFPNAPQSRQAGGNLSGKVDAGARPIGEPGERMDTMARARLYMATLPGAISGQGGHAATLRAAAECFRFGLTESEAWGLLCEFNDRCAPKWSERELRHKLREGRKLVDKEPGAFGKHLAADLPRAADLAGGVFKHVTTIPAEPAPAEDLAGQASPAADPPGFPAELLYPPGIVGEICKHMEATAYKPQPILNLANALAFWGAVVGRKVRTPSDLRSNLYCLGVGESGCGKDHSRKVVKRICAAANVADKLLGGEEVSSDASIYSSVNANPSILFQFDEIGHALSQANSKYAAAHMRNIGPTFMRLFSSANTLLIGKEYAGRQRVDTDQPNACLYGTTVPGRLYEGLTPSEITDGFLGRMLVFQSDAADPEERERPAADVPQNIVATVEAWVKRADLPPAGAGNLAGKAPHTVAFNAEAVAAFDRFAAECRQRKAELRDGGGLDALYARAPEHAKKVALVIAAGVDWTPTVTGDLAEYSVKLVRHLSQSLIAAIREGVTDSDFGRLIQKIRRLIVAAKSRGLTARELTRKTQGMQPRTRADALSELLNTGEVATVSRETSRGPTATVYVGRSYLASLN